MKKHIKTIQDYEDVVCDMLHNFLEDFPERKGLTRELREDDMFEEGEVLFMYTQRGMELYDRACKRYYDLAKKIFPDILTLKLSASNMIFP